jgi:hypothetical protein
LRLLRDLRLRKVGKVDQVRRAVHGEEGVMGYRAYDRLAFRVQGIQFQHDPTPGTGQIRAPEQMAIDVRRTAPIIDDTV